jgi:hypothetical protein
MPLVQHITEEQVSYYMPSGSKNRGQRHRLLRAHLHHHLQQELIHLMFKFILIEAQIAL